MPDATDDDQALVVIELHHDAIRSDLRRVVRGEVALELFQKEMGVLLLPKGGELVPDPARHNAVVRRELPESLSAAVVRTTRHTLQPQLVTDLVEVDQTAGCDVGIRLPELLREVRVDRLAIDRHLDKAADHVVVGLPGMNLERLQTDLGLLVQLHRSARHRDTRVSRTIP